MKDPMIVAAGSRGSGSAEGSVQVWWSLGWIGSAFLAVGAVDFGLAWVPLDFGTPEWEFATVTQSFNGLPILLLGIGLLNAAAEQTGRRWWGMVGAGAALVLLLWVLTGFVFWANNVSLALTTVPPEVAIGVQKAIAKTAVQSVVYSTVLVYLLGRAWRARRTVARGM